MKRSLLDLKGRLDKPFIAVLAVLIALLFFLQHFTGNKGTYVIITQNNEIIGQYSLYQDHTFSVSTSDNHSNTVHIQNGQVWIEDSDCPDQLCVKQGSISHNGESIICLPHKLVIQVKAAQDNNIDSVSQ